jgi:hypothetical protein
VTTPADQSPSRAVAERGKCGLTTLQLDVLDHACEPIWDAFGGTYLVGTAFTGGDYRDVDVRTILPDREFDRLFGPGLLRDDGEVDRHHPSGKVPGRALWGLVCMSIGRYLVSATGLPIDYQIQRMTQTNAKYDGPRNPLGMGMREYAGAGDATHWTEAVLPLPRPITESEEAAVMEFLQGLQNAHSEQGAQP